MARTLPSPLANPRTLHTPSTPDAMHIRTGLHSLFYLNTHPDQKNASLRRPPPPYHWPRPPPHPRGNLVPELALTSAVPHPAARTSTGTCPPPPPPPDPHSRTLTHANTPHPRPHSTTPLSGDEARSHQAPSRPRPVSIDNPAGGQTPSRSRSVSTTHLSREPVTLERPRASSLTHTSTALQPPSTHTSPSPAAPSRRRDTPALPYRMTFFYYGEILALNYGTELPTLWSIHALNGQH
ncbi:hypothetical protein DFH09DRAFT_1330418 [Mycena vulgaris]|nr:hypothetical protein DFH09DRAFT_1330418 [Mycena vulgaris]